MRFGVFNFWLSALWLLLDWTTGPLSGRSLSFAYDDRLRRTNLTFRSGSVTNGTIAVNGTSAQRQGEYFRHEASASGVAGALTSNGVTVNGTNALSNRVRYVPRQQEALEYDADGNRTVDGRWELA